ncbi:MAG TPA: type II toxin-antitoxin system RelE/ParE family toxin [Pyrinomonadaceae bacterium]|nr:type II toxin-antitoxin system RelE/ParE family toxin [Pyrinomonadaceae bacterium]
MNESSWRRDKSLTIHGVGRIVPEKNDENVRELIYQNYRIIYRIKRDQIELLTVIHGARDLTALKPAPWEFS